VWRKVEPSTVMDAPGEPRTCVCPGPVLSKPNNPPLRSARSGLLLIAYIVCLLDHYVLDRYRPHAGRAFALAHRPLQLGMYHCDLC
jgi:hypothetical protein